MSGPTDTTRTDYFALKARGISPDTPLIPLNRKRPRESTDLQPSPTKSHRVSQDQKSPIRTPTPQSTTAVAVSHSPLSISKSIVTYTTEEEELFASARELRTALAEGEAWFREQREKEEERSQNNSISSERQGSETEKERRLRDFDSATPSRTSIRLEKMNGGKGLYCMDDYRRRKETAREEVGAQEQKEKRGFAALTNGNMVNGVNGTFTGQLRASSSAFGAESASAHKGSSAEDAIEL